MGKLFTGIWILALLAGSAHAEPRWCSIQPDSAYKIVYPPIARAARVSGLVIARITYLPTGEVIQVESVAGPVMLKDSVSKQVQLWRIHTGAVGDSPCMSLAMFDFGFDEATPVPAPPAGVLRMSIVAQIVVLSDPQAIIGKKHWWSRR